MSSITPKPPATSKVSYLGMKVFLQIGQFLGLILTIYSAVMVSPLFFRLTGMALGVLVVLLLRTWQDLTEEETEKNPVIEKEVVDDSKLSEHKKNGYMDLGRRDENE